MIYILKYLDQKNATQIKAATSSWRITSKASWDRHKHGSVVFSPSQRQLEAKCSTGHELGRGSSPAVLLFPSSAILSQQKELEALASSAVISSLCTGCLSGWQAAPLLIWIMFNSSRSQCKRCQMSEVILQLFPPAWFETSLGWHSHLHKGKKLPLSMTNLLNPWLK